MNIKNVLFQGYVKYKIAKNVGIKNLLALAIIKHNQKKYQ